MKRSTRNGLLAGSVFSAILFVTAPALIILAVTATIPGTSNIGSQSSGGGGSQWSPGNIISDDVFYNTAAMSESAIRDWISEQNSGCASDQFRCARDLSVSWDAFDGGGYCKAVPAGSGDAARAISLFSTACGINPQVMLVTWVKESGPFSHPAMFESDYDAAFGYDCPDTGPGGTAACAPDKAGFANQLRGMAWQWAKYKVEIPAGKYEFQAGKTSNILWNVKDTGCGGAPVLIENTATASLYTYTPYQPNSAALAAYPGAAADKCAAYGNRNFFFLFQKFFGPTGGGTVPGTVGGGPGELGSGVDVVVPGVGTMKAPSEKRALVLRRALSQLGARYVWGGGNPMGASGGGFDCSGLMLYAYAGVGVELPHRSAAQSKKGIQSPFAQAVPGDLLFWGGGSIHHVAMYLGVADGKHLMVEAQQSGVPVLVSTVRTGGDFNGVAVHVPIDGDG